MTTVRLKLPYPPTVNHVYGLGRKGTLYMKPEGKAYTERIAWTVKSLCRTTKLFGPLAVAYILHPPDKRKRDIANCEKVLTDAIQASGLFDDDFQIATMILSRGEPVVGGSVEVVITATTPCPAVRKNIVERAVSELSR